MKIFAFVAGGDMKDGLSGLAKIVDQVIAGQFERLKRYVETGKP